MDSLTEHPWDDETQRFLALVRKQHEGQVRAGGQQQWQHCEAVAQTLDDALAHEAHISPEKRRELLLGALGHDLYEDSKIQPQEIIADYGKNVHDRILGLTNSGGDSDVREYVEHMQTAPEEDRLIKLADLWHNYSSVTKNRDELGQEWIVHWFLPIVEPMITRITTTEFHHYPHAGAILLKKATDARQALLSAIHQPYSTSVPSSPMPEHTPSSLTDAEAQEKEPWDFDQFRQFYDEIAKKWSGWPLADANHTEDQLRRFYENGMAKTLREFADSTVHLDQLM